MEFYRCEIIPREDPCPGLVGEERKAALRSMALRVCDFLQTEDGLSAVPAEPEFKSLRRLDSYFFFNTDPIVCQNKLGIPDVRTVEVAYPVDHRTFRGATYEDMLDVEKPYFASLFVGIGTGPFDEVQEWPSDALDRHSVSFHSTIVLAV